jgi:HEAT repeat protein
MQTTGQAKPAAPKPKPPTPTAPPEFQSEKIDKLSEPELIALVKKADASVFEKAKACQRLANIGTEAAVPAVATLLDHPQLSTYARYALEPIPGAASDDALRAALPKLKGTLLIGVINSIGQRQDAKATGALSKLLNDSDPEVGRAAASALGRISGVEAAKTLQSGLGKTKGAVRMAVADAGLLCAEGLLEKGQRAEALSLYNTLIATDVPKPVRLAAMHGIIAAETSLSRPR